MPEILGPPFLHGFPATRRSLAYAAVLKLSQDTISARFALARAMDRLQTEDLLELLDECDETIAPTAGYGPLRSVTPSDEIR